MYDILIVGAGISGASIARELSRYNLKIALVDKESDVSNGSTKANSAIVHAGYDPRPGTLMAKYNKLGNFMYEELCKELNVPFERCGSLVVAFNDGEMKHISELKKRAEINGVPGVEIINKEEIAKLEPNIQEGVIGALYAKTAGIVGPWELTIAMVEDAVLNGVELYLDTLIEFIEKRERIFIVKSSNGKILKCKKIINCAGVYADEIHNMVCEKSYEIRPRKGEYLVLDKTEGIKIKRPIFQCPTEMGKGVLLTPTVHGNLLVGPDSQDIFDKEDLSTELERINYIKKVSMRSAKNIDFSEVIRAFSGLRAESTKGDFIIEEAAECSGFYDVAGIKSPGLTAAPAIAKYIVELIKNSDLELVPKDEKEIKIRKKYTNFMKLSNDEKMELIKENSKYGRVICRCEMITEGEIVEVLKGPIKIRSIDSIKKRCRPGSGRCQGGFCGPRVQEIISREREIPMEKVILDKENSYILTGEIK